MSKWLLMYHRGLGYKEVLWYLEKSQGKFEGEK